MLCTYIDSFIKLILHGIYNLIFSHCLIIIYNKVEIYFT